MLEDNKTKSHENENQYSCSVCQIPVNHSSISFFHYLRQRKETWVTIIAAILILPGLIYQEILQLPSLTADSSSFIAMLLAGIPVFRNGWTSIRKHHEININVLMTIAAVGAVIIGVFTEAAMVMVLFSISEALEEFTIEKSRNSIRSLMNLVPRQATVIKKSENQIIDEIKVELNEIDIGDVILVKPGEQIPMDGTVIGGSSTVNQAPITGESALIEKTKGSEVFASSINGEGSLQIEVSNRASDNTISRMIALVEEAQEKRIPAQHFIDKFARYYTPVIVLLSLLAATIPPLFFSQPFFNTSPEMHGWLYRGLSLLVVGCPCALVISTPVAIISAISNASRNGVLVKGGIHLEKLSQVKIFAFDKTGTLTEGHPSVVSTRTQFCSTTCVDDPKNKNFNQKHTIKNCEDCREMLALASSVEIHSEHPVAYAITSEAAAQNLNHRYPPADSARALVGNGVTGNVQEKVVTIGSHKFFKTIPHPEHHCKAAKQDSLNGYTPIMVEANGKYLGTITIADQIHTSSKSALIQLKEMGYESLIMLTGDVYQTARSIADAAGITKTYASLLPGEKVKKIKEIQDQYGPVAMVGDGINDAPALATADIGIAIGGSGTNSHAMETADITLMSGDLKQLPFAVRLSKKTMHLIKFNLLFILLIKLIFIALVSSGLGTMWMAVLADTGLTLLVTLNGMRLLRFS